MAATAALTIVKAFPYRDETEEFSNTYHLDTQPADDAAWAALSHLVVSLERAIYTSRTSIVRSTGHNAGNPVAVFEHNYVGDAAHPGSGLFAPTTGFTCPGDASAWVRWGTTQLSTRGKPIYLRSYFHDVHSIGASGPDALHAEQEALMWQYGTQWLNGMAAGGVTYHRAGPRGAVAQNMEVGHWITTRTLERRGRRRQKFPSGAVVQLPPVLVP